MSKLNEQQLACHDIARERNMTVEDRRVRSLVLNSVFLICKEEIDVSNPLTDAVRFDGKDQPDRVGSLFRSCPSVLHH